MRNLELHKIQVSSLTDKSYDKLTIRRREGVCYLLMDIQGERHAHVDQTGNIKEYRHVWQIKNCLKEKFYISENEISYIE